MSKWISVEKELPPIGLSVFCTNEDLQKLYRTHDEIYTSAWHEDQMSWTSQFWGEYGWLSKVKPLYWAYLAELAEED